MPRFIESMVSHLGRVTGTEETGMVLIPESWIISYSRRLALTRLIQIRNAWNQPNYPSLVSTLTSKYPRTIFESAPNLKKLVLTLVNYADE